MTALEVWGSPIGHSRSPQLHLAAYRALGLDWTYERREVTEDSFAASLAAVRGELGGLSLTMPLKTRAFEAASWRDARAERTGVANTLLFGDDSIRAFNTDIGGLTHALVAGGAAGASRGRLIGAGGTAISAVVAFAELGIDHLEIVARRPERAVDLLTQAETLGLQASVRTFAGDAFAPVDATVATLPGGTALDPDVEAALADAGGTLVDVVYAPWPTSLATAWQAAGHTAASGLDMLLHQAVLQVRVFTTGQVADPVDNEPTVVAAMRAALMGD